MEDILKCDGSLSQSTDEDLRVVGQWIISVLKTAAGEFKGKLTHIPTKKSVSVNLGQPETINEAVTRATKYINNYTIIS